MIGQWIIAGTLLLLTAVVGAVVIYLPKMVEKYMEGLARA